ncbi:MAG: 4-hydroxythreonine-4-phosphate dehydrogenase PdxA [Spirochaetia bacterium]|nr:4-hydroxythreonine-4-phosphate dehydrogenase PdxA [Spirochaetia bacterium]
MNEKPVLGILLGDAAGVGSEILAKLASSHFFDAYCRPLFIGDIRVMQRGFDVIGKTSCIKAIEDAREASWDQEGFYPLLNRKNVDPCKVPFGKVSLIAGRACIDMLATAVQLSKEKLIAGFCFVPLNKAGLREAGCLYESEHHFLAHAFGVTGPFGEINVVDDLWSTRTTSHIPIKDVSSSLSVERIDNSIFLCNEALKSSGVKKPRIAICALNPHCGENGKCGTEEIEIITPAIEKAEAMGIDVTGPYSSDITFIKAFKGDFDGVVTMYHDQGQIALKLKGFDQGITIAGGMPVPIATCAHGTAYDIAGTGVVNPHAFENAVRMVSRMAEHLAQE